MSKIKESLGDAALRLSRELIAIREQMLPLMNHSDLFEKLPDGGVGFVSCGLEAVCLLNKCRNYIETAADALAEVSDDMDSIAESRKTQAKAKAKKGGAA